MSKKLKKCTNCEVRKNMTEFYNSKRYLCTECERETARKRMKKYNATPKGKVMQALNNSRKSARRAGADIKDDLTFFDVAITLDQSECSYCHQDIDWKDRTIDHIISFSRGGHNTFCNITMACRACNSRKSDYPAIAFLHQHQHQRGNKWAIRRLVGSVARRKAVDYKDAYMILFKNAVDYYIHQKEARAS